MSALTYEEFWGAYLLHHVITSIISHIVVVLCFLDVLAMFGEGQIDNFEEILDTKLSPFLSSV